MGIDVTTLNIDLSKLNIDNNNNNETQPDDADKDPNSTACTLYLTKYAKTKKNRVKYDAGNDEERIAKTTELNTKYEDEFESLGKKIKDAEIAKIDILDAKNRLSILAKKPQYVMEAYLDRLNKTKTDTEESTKLPYDPVKKTLSDCLAALTETDESRREKIEKEIENAEKELEEEEKNNKDKKAKKNKEKKKKKQEDDVEKTKANKTSYEQGNATTIAAKWGKTYDHQVDEYQDTTDKELKEYEDAIKSRAIKQGEEKAVKDINKFNEKLERQAKKIYEAQQNNTEKAKVKTKAALQKIKLALGAKLGL